MTAQNVPATSRATTRMGPRELMSQRLRRPVISIFVLPMSCPLLPGNVGEQAVTPLLRHYSIAGRKFQFLPKFIRFPLPPPAPGLCVLCQSAF